MKDDLSGSQTTGYRGARVEVIEAGNQLIQYRIRNHMKGTVSYTHLTLPTTPYV